MPIPTSSASYFRNTSEENWKPPSSASTSGRWAPAPTLILLALAYIVFQIFTPLTFIECLVIALIFAAAASALGMVIATIARSEDAAIWIGVFFTMVMVMLGGTFFEISEGSIFATLSKFSINTYANDAFRTLITEGGSLADLVLEIGVMAGVAVVGMGLSRVLFKVMPGGK
jgi:ABC-type multidrug transport system permease subunit